MLFRMTEGITPLDLTMARTGQRTANTVFLYPIEDQNVTKSGCSWSPQKSRDREQDKFTFRCGSADYKICMFAVRSWHGVSIRLGQQS